MILGTTGLANDTNTNIEIFNTNDKSNIVFFKYNTSNSKYEKTKIDINCIYARSIVYYNKLYVYEYEYSDRNKINITYINATDPDIDTNDVLDYIFYLKFHTVDSFYSHIRVIFDFKFEQITNQKPVFNEIPNIPSTIYITYNICNLLIISNGPKGRYDKINPIINKLLQKMKSDTFIISLPFKYKKFNTNITYYLSIFKYDGEFDKSNSTKLSGYTTSRADCYTLYGDTQKNIFTIL